jgi:hypothetical protein
MSETSQKTEQIDITEFEAEQNELGFFNLLLQIDKRINPDNYKKPEQKND